MATTTPQPVEFEEDGIPAEGLAEAADELIELFGGTTTSSGAANRSFVLPLRRGVAAAGGVQCTLSWQPAGEGEATVRLVCDREVDAPRAQRVALLVAGVIGSLLFLLWPFMEARRQFGALAWLGGAVAIAVYLLTLRKTSGGIAFDFLQRLARRQRATVTDDR